MMKTTKVSNMAFSLLIASSVALTACQRQESGHSPAKVSKQVAAIQTPQLVATQVATPAGIVDNPAVTDLLHRVVRSDLPGMTFNQVKALFPATCIANDDDRSISCPGVAGLVSISYGGGQDGILDMVFSGGMASCKVLKMLVSEKFGAGEDNSAQNNDGVCDVYWKKISKKNNTYYANLGKQKGDDEVALQIGAEQGP